MQAPHDPDPLVRDSTPGRHVRRAYVRSLNRNGVSDSILPTYETGRNQPTTKRDRWSVQVPALRRRAEAKAYVQLGSRRRSSTHVAPLAD